MGDASPACRGRRYPVEALSRCVWPCFRFPLSFREVEELVLGRDAVVPCETVRRWCATFGQADANGLRRRPRSGSGDKWYPDEAFIKIDGERQHLWRAVDRDGTVLDVLVQSRRDTAAARCFFRRPMKKTRAVPRVVGTAELRSCRAAHREVVPFVEHRQSKYLNNRSENSRQPTRRRERAVEGFRVRRLGKGGSGAQRAAAVGHRPIGRLRSGGWRWWASGARGSALPWWHGGDQWWAAEGGRP
ncbi:IS6 family transposase, partial [Streptomyces sp. NPDC050388]|uniref:IS6 family transposase n=1 Tax=Streptomyces sp. NPDC050388 TaxID=3155781 RepID=UPI0034210D9F